MCEVLFERETELALSPTVPCDSPPAGEDIAENFVAAENQLLEVQNV